uniref:SAGA-associated factor 29 isoform X1 n=1 Tax=Diabrotica virgifera virgifera TaxID=50390 RepID=A0A6P7G881_DIAVI
MPFTADAAAAQQVQERLKSVQQLVHEIEKKRAQCELGIAALQNYTQDEKGGHSSQKLKSLYKNVIAQTEQEEDVIRKALLKITEIRNIKNERRIQARIASNKESLRKGIWMKMLYSSAQTLPLYVGKIGEKPPPLCGAIPADPNYIAKVGDMVAALAKHATEGENWILAEVVCYNHSTSKYEVDDILKEQNQKGRHTLSRSRVIPLPLMRANPETDPQALFPQGTLVMALFPQTTCFYQALVNKPPSTHMDEYELLFEDPNYTEGYSPPHSVVQRYVIACKQKNKQTGQGTS